MADDKHIIEAQQKVFDVDPNDLLLAIGADAPLTYFRRLFSRKLNALPPRPRSRPRKRMAQRGDGRCAP